MLKNYILKSSKNVRIAAVSIALLLAIILYYFLKSNLSPPQEIKVVEVEQVTKKNISQSIRLTGKLKARHSTNLTAKAAGILNISLPSGTQVTKDSLIASISSIEIEKRYTLCSSAEIIAKEQFERAQKLFKSGSYSKAEFEAIQNKWISAQKDLADAKIAFDKLKFYAPFDGIIGSYKFREGAQLRGDESIVSFYDPNNLTLEFDIPASAMPHINNGQNLYVAGKNYQLTHVQKMLDEEKHMSPAHVDITCSNCLIGSNLDLDLTIEQKENVIVIPFEAVFLRDGASSVYVIKNNQAEPRKVELGIREKTETEIISGLEAGESVVIRGTNRIYPGSLVKIHQPS